MTSKKGIKTASQTGRTIDKSVIQMPKELQDKKIPMNLSIRDLLGCLSFITQAESEETVDWRVLFSLEPPNADLEQLFQVCVLPPEDTLEKILENFTKITANSVLDWSWMKLGKEVRYPLTVLAIYREYGRANKTRTSWRNAEAWVWRWGGQTRGMEGAASLAERLTCTLEWDTYIRATGTSVHTNDLLSILGDEWMSDNQLDLILQVLTERLGNTSQLHEAVIAPCIFFQHVKNVYDTQNRKNRLTVPLLERYKSAFLSGAKKLLYFISLVGQNHFVAWKIDYSAATLCHGDSLHVSESKLNEIKICMLWWMRSIYVDDRKCTYLGNALAHGDQTKGDAFSCGIIACNVIAHEIFGDELWDMKNRRRLRLEAFNAIIMHHNQRRSVRRSNLSAEISDDEESDILEVRTEISEDYIVAEEDEGMKTALNGDTELGEDSEGAAYTSDFTSAPPTSATSSLLPSPTIFNQRLEEQSYSKVSGDNTHEERAETREQTRHRCQGESQQSPRPRRNHGHAEPEESCTVHHGAYETAGETGRNVQDDSGPKRDRALVEEDQRPNKKSKTTTVGPMDFFLRPRDSVKQEVQGTSQKVPLFLVDENDQLEESSWSEDEESWTNEEDACRSDEDRNPKITRQGHSARHARKMRAARLSGTQTINESLYNRKIRRPSLTCDANARFDPDNWRVQHSRCGRWVRLKSLYQAGEFIKHATACDGKPILDDYFCSQTDLRSSSVSLKSSDLSLRLPNKPPSGLVSCACTGLTAAHDSRIKTYLRRPTALGGGGKSLGELSRERYGKLYSKLKSKGKKEINRLHEASWQWTVKNRHGAIFSTSCEQTILIPESYAEIDKVCKPCSDLLRIKVFRTAISRPEPDTRNLRFVTKPYQHSDISKKFLRIKGVSELIDPKNKQTSTAVRYAIGVANGKFDDHVVFTGLVETVLLHMERKEKGKAMTNFKYPPAFNEFIAMVHMVCPRAYRLLKDHFPVRCDREIRRRNGRDPQFLGGISSRSFERAAKFVKSLNIPGNHVALSADDTKLLSTFRPFLDREKDRWYIVGGTGDPYLINSPEELREELQRAELEKATKVRLWVLMVPFPKVPPIVLAAVAINDSVSSEELFTYTIRVIDGLHEHGIWPVSYACDGTEKERANQRRLRDEAHSSDIRRIHAPSSRAAELTINIAQYHGKPIALIQDSLHARKTGRNNIQSGTKTMVLGDYPVLYRHIRDMAFCEDSPLYRRDVENADKQDDRAAARVVSADALQWLLSHGKEYFGTAVFLFVVGELVDSIQNRTLSLSERVRMVLRSFYFFAMWKKFITSTGYPLRRACLSREALNIFSMIITGFFELLFVYRDYFPGKSVPMLPWLHSSEACEHVFAECRKLVKDFDFAAFLHMMPKIHSMLRYTLQFGTTSTEDAKGRAMGYIHTYMDIEGLSLSNLAKFPTDEEIFKIAKLALDDAEEIWMQLEVFPQDLESGPRPISHGMDNDSHETDDDDTDSVLPALSFWAPDSDNETKEEKPKYKKDEQGRPALSIMNAEHLALEQLFEEEQQIDATGAVRLDRDEKMMLNLSCAKLFLDFDTDVRIEELHEPTQEEFDIWVQSYAHNVGKTLADCLPPISEPPQPERSLTASSHMVYLMRESLLEVRRNHESMLERKAVRTSTKKTADDSSKVKTSESPPTADATTTSMKSDTGARRLLIRKMNEVLRPHRTVAKGTGAERRLRWTESDNSGNAANAAVVAVAKATQSLSKRSSIYSACKIPRHICQRLSNAGINGTYPIREGMFAIVYSDGRLFVTQVLSLFSKGGGSHGGHSYIAEADKVTQLSYVSVQAFEQTRGPLFRAKTSSTGNLQVRYFPHITSSQILLLLPDTPIGRKGQTIIELSRLSFQLWSEILSVAHIFPSVMKESRSR